MKKQTHTNLLHPFQPCLGPGHLVEQQIAMCGPVALLQMTLLSLVIHMSNIPSFPYRQLVSVATLTRQDGIDFLRLAPETGIVTETTCYPPSHANQALASLRADRFEGHRCSGAMSAVRQQIT
jgi:hypothetical protein